MQAGAGLFTENKRGGGGQHAIAKKRKGRSRAGVSDGTRVRKERKETSAGEGGSVTALAEVWEWEAERVPRHVAN